MVYWRGRVPRSQLLRDLRWDGRARPAALVALDRGVLDPMVYLQAAASVSLDRRVMDEYIRSGVTNFDYNHSHLTPSHILPPLWYRGRRERRCGVRSGTGYRAIAFAAS